jgi:hypothetical protein
MAAKALALVIAFVCLCVGSGASASVLTQRAPGTSTTPAEAYCASTGGIVQKRIPEYGTNGGTPLILALTREFCQYDNKDHSQINLMLDTLYTTLPTLAALAYYAEVKPGSCQGSPGSCYCSLLGGTDLFGGVNAAGGGWVLEGTPTDVLDSCVFPDESSIDSYGLFYHSAGIIRGINLGRVLRYHKPK